MKRFFSYSFIFTFLWMGFVLAISFMEAWIKFLAPSITMLQGLDVGRLVFGALSLVEKGFFLLTLASLIYFHRTKIKLILFAVLAILLSLQWFWLLPVLDQRALEMLAGIPVKSSSIHFYYIGAEVLKVSLLTSIGLNQIHEFRAFWQRQPHFNE